MHLMSVSVALSFFCLGWVPSHSIYTPPPPLARIPPSLATYCHCFASFSTVKNKAVCGSLRTNPRSSMTGETSRKTYHAVTHPVSRLQLTFESDLSSTLSFAPHPNAQLHDCPYPDDVAQYATPPNLQFVRTSVTTDPTDVEISGPQRNVVVGSSNPSDPVDYPESSQTTPCLPAVHIPADLSMHSYIASLDPFRRPVDGTLRLSSGISMLPNDMRLFHMSQSAVESPSSSWAEAFRDDCVGDSSAEENMLTSPLVNQQLLFPVYSRPLLPHNVYGAPSGRPTVLTLQLSNNLLQPVDDPENDQILQSFHDSEVCDDTETDSAGSYTPRSSPGSPATIISETPTAIQHSNCIDEVSVVASGSSPSPIRHAVSGRLRSAANQSLRSAITPCKARSVKRQKMHKCVECGKPFPRPSGLATHMNSHSGAKPHKCPVPDCDKWFAVRSNAKRHLVKAHGITAAIGETPSTPPYNVGFEQPVVNDVHDSGRQPSRYRWIPQNATSNESSLFSTSAVSFSLLFGNSYDDLGTKPFLQYETDSTP